MLEHLKQLVAQETARTGKRRTIHLTDDTLRDGQQCLWATRMRTEHMLPIAERMDRAGFLAIQAIALVQFDASVLFLNQDPFERIRLLRERMTRTPLRAAIRSNLMRGFFPVADDITELFVERQVANGVRDIGIFDALMCSDNLAPSIAAAHRLGAAVTLLLGYNIAPGYDDALYARKAREAVERFGAQTVTLADAAGIMTIDRVRTLVPAMKQAIGDRARLEFNTHCLTGLGPLLAIEAAVHGADSILTAVDPMANGNSLPASQMIARNLREIGFDVVVDDRLVDEVGDYLGALAEREGRPVGVPAEYEPSHYVTQYAGGAMSNLQSQLELAGISDKLPAVLEEIGRVRVELGSPIMVTPYPAIVSAQAVMNVLNGERYKVVPDEVKKYVCGYFGELPLPVDGNVKDRILANGSKDVALTPPVLAPVLPGLRQRYKSIGDDELLLRYMYGDEKVNGLGRTGQGDAYSVHHPIVDLVAGLATRKTKSQVHITGTDFSLSAN
ncbi:carboxylase [Variovorax sp. OV329]|uniref:carboxylase n=1 Tax=Variovorax sp. OV329 TaxID=1882825 RepID=UPI0008F0967D|nr:carboxylase [Variovorax sp. OV329]SFN51308.1 oxaloacetate decarboxylase, alpha subunit [Variovorax sp. OV329]